MNKLKINMLKFNYKKGLLIISLLLIICFSVSAVSAIDAVDNTISDDISVSVVEADADVSSDISVSAIQADTNIGDREVSNNIGYSQNSSNDITKVSAGNTFATIQTKVDNAKAGSTIKLSGTYTGSGKAININKNLIIDGCGATLDAKGLSQIFYITGKGCTIKNIIFKNAYAKYGGAIYWNGTSGTLTNCTFTNCSSKDYGDGGCVYWAGSNGKLTKCKFINSQGADNGGSVYWTGSNGVLTNSTFTSSSSSTSAGAISWGGINGKVYGCTFKNSHTRGSGGDIYWSASNGTLYNCTFLNSNSESSAGSIYWNGEYANIYNSYFINSTAKGFTNNQGSGGAIYLLKANGKITNCTFTSCSATTMSSPIAGRGGAIALYDNAGKTVITNCDFTDCYSIEGGAIYGTPSQVKITKSDFDKCSADNSAGAIYLLGSNQFIDDCDFNECTSKSIGGAISLASTNSILNNSHFESCSGIFGGAVFCYGSTISLDNSEFKNCNVTSSNSNVNGGSVFWFGNNGKLTNCKFTNSKAATSGSSSSYGGAIHWNGDNGILSNCKFTNSSNQGDNSYGGAIHWNGDNGILSNCKFTNSSNQGDNSYGGAIYWNNTKFIINNASFLDSFAKYGHAIYAKNSSIYNSTFYINDEDGETEEDMVYKTSVPLLKSQNDKFLYSKYISILTAENMIKDVTNKTSFTVKLTNRAGKPIVGNVTFILKGKTYNVTTNTEGICRLQPTSQLAAGNYSIDVMFNGKNPYYPSDNISAILIVTKLDADLVVFDISNAYYGHKTNLTALLGVPGYDVEGPVTFYVDNVKVGSVNVVNGKAIYTYSPTKTGKFVLKAIYNGSNIYGSDSDVANITVNKLDTSISISSGVATYKSPVKLTAKVSSDVTVTDGKVSFYVDNVKVGSVNVKNGVATLTYSPTKSGTSTIKAFYSNSNLFKDSNALTTMHVDKANAIVSLSQSGSYYKSTKVNVKLVSADGNLLSGEKVSITIGGKTVSLNTNDEGVASYNVPLAPGTYSVSAKASGNNVVSNIASGKVTIKKSASVTITPTKLTTTYNSTKYFQVKVTKGSTPVVGAKIYIKIYTGKKYKKVIKTTNSKGIIKYAGSRLSLGVHKVVVGSAEPTSYMTAKVKNSSITVNKAPTIVSAPKVTNKYKQSAYFKVVVKNKATGKVVNGLKIKLKVFTGSTYKVYVAETNPQGVASFNTKYLSKGNHKVVISSGNKYYIVSKTSYIIIK